MLPPLKIGDILFSGSVYQIEVIDPALPESVWVFLKTKDHGKIEDLFCSCEAVDRGCCHTSFALDSVQDSLHRFIHERYEHSFIRELGSILFQRFSSKKLPKMSTEEIKLAGFSLRWKSDAVKKAIQELLEKPEASEENSLALSNLSEEELEEYRAGKGSESLLFEISFWGELSKYIFIKGPLEIQFEGESLPEVCILNHPQFELSCTLKKENWEKLIPTITQDNFSNLDQCHIKVYHTLKDLVQSIEFDPKQMSLHLKLKKKPKVFDGAVKVGSWLFKPHEGFFPIETIKSEFEAHELNAFFDRYSTEVNDFFKVQLCHSEDVSLQWSLSFDKQWNLQITPYLLSEGDLSEAREFGRWTYVPGKGFYLISHREKAQYPEKVAEGDVYEFIQKHPQFLNQYPGFSVHVSSMDALVSYTVDERGALRFHQKMAHEAKAQTHTFGKWMYVEHEGFFVKTDASHQIQLPFGDVLRPDQIASFIRRNQKELELIPGFFMKDALFSSAGIDVKLISGEKIQVMPHYEVAEAYKGTKLRYYEEWVYVNGEGFYELPAALRLPEKYREPLVISKEDVKNFLESELKSLEPWVHHLDPRLRAPAFLKLCLDQISEGPFHSWKLHLHFKTERGDIPLNELMAALYARKFYLFSPQGCIALFKEKLVWMRRLKPEAILEDGSVLLTTAELLRLYAFEEIEASAEASTLFREIVELKKIHDPDFRLLKSNLRPYQQKGALWIYTLYHYQLGGLLADEMGLGKTHQAMALIAALKQDKPQSRALVVCPTSVLYHWEDKLKEFLPSIKVLTFHGPFRKNDLEKPFDLLLTSYGILRNEGEWFNENYFNVVIYDEIQAAKNHRSKLYTVLERVKGGVKVGLTGTPIENRLRELKALFDLTLPGYMPPEADYLRHIVYPIERDNNMERKGLLNRLIKPFVMRRMKKDVMSDLPEKTEEMARCDFLDEQETLYREVLLQQKESIMHDLSDPSKSVPYLHVFALLSKLKQICDHPALYYKKIEDYQHYHSGKWELFKELLNEARDSGQKVVVYSQYLGMLDIIELYLKEAGIGFASIRGATRDRREQARLFAEDPSCEVFVASLKAAGLGIDLTSASVVIHYDRWWNAAREDQATDRVHRFGQSRGVQVFKLMTKNSFEERIDQIIERKKVLIEESIGIDDQYVFKTLTREEIYDLLRMQ